MLVDDGAQEPSDHISNNDGDSEQEGEEAEDDVAADVGSTSQCILSAYMHVPIILYVSLCMSPIPVVC